MNDVALKLKLSLTCSYCTKILKDLVELPCGDLICQEHLNEKDVVQKNKIKCSTCNQEFKVKSHDFKSNKSFQKLINDRTFLSVDEIDLKNEIEDSIKIFFKMYEELKLTLSKTKLDLECHNHFQEIRFQLDMHREKLKEKIDDIYMEMIKKTKEFEASYLKNLNEKLSSSLKSFEIKTIDEDLKELEETFRNPNLLIESIRELNVKQQENIKTIESKLNEITQIKDDIKASNQFKPYLSFNKDFLGQLNLKEYLAFDPFKSQILTCQLPLELIKLCEFDLKDRFKLLYRANQDGFGSNHFHSKCDGKANTLTILKANGYIFGGFTSVSWGSSNQYKKDPNAFLFSLTNKDNQPCKLKIKPYSQQYAIYCHSESGPTFGDYDIFIASNSNTNESESNLGCTYPLPQYADGLMDGEYQYDLRFFLANSNQFLLDEIEVYQKE